MVAKIQIVKNAIQKYAVGGIVTVMNKWGLFGIIKENVKKVVVVKCVNHIKDNGHLFLKLKIKQPWITWINK